MFAKSGSYFSAAPYRQEGRAERGGGCGRGGWSMSQLAEVLGNLLLARVPLGDGQGQLDEALLVCLHLDPVDCQEDDGRMRQRKNPG